MKRILILIGLITLFLPSSSGAEEDGVEVHIAFARGTSWLSPIIMDTRNIADAVFPTWKIKVYIINNGDKPIFFTDLLLELMTKNSEPILNGNVSTTFLFKLDPGKTRFFGFSTGYSTYKLLRFWESYETSIMVTILNNFKCVSQKNKKLPIIFDLKEDVR